MATKDGVDLQTKAAMDMDRMEVIKVGVHRVSGEVTAVRQAITAMVISTGAIICLSVKFCAAINDCY